MKKIRKLILCTILVLILISIVSATEPNSHTTNSTDSNQSINDKQTVSRVDTANTMKENKINTDYKDNLRNINKINAVNNITIQRNNNSKNGNISSHLTTSVLTDTNNDNTLSEDIKSLSDLNDIILAASEGSEVILDSDYSYSEGESIVYIEKNLTINGNGHTVSGDYDSGIFGVSSAVTSVTFKNIILEEGNATDNGGAISCINPSSSLTSTSITLINCTIECNSVKYQSLTSALGGGVYCEGDLTIIDSTFNDNIIIDGRGGAIYCGGNLNIKNTSFSENTVELGPDGFGGAIYCIGECTIYDSYFHKNIVGIDKDQNGTYGGAIYSKGNLYIYNTNFEENEATVDDGGSIYCEGNIYGNSLKFSYNKAYNGGAIYCKGETHINSSEFIENMHVQNSTFKDDEWYKLLFDQATPVKPSEGGAIYSKGKCYIDSCKFNNNLVCEHGGAIYAKSDLTITGKNSFTNNTAIRPAHFDLNIFKWKWMDKDGGAIYCCGNLNIKNANFTNNLAFVDGGTIYCEGKTTISNSNFKNNKAEGILIRSPTGGAIRSNKLITLNNCSFDENIASIDGGAIFGDENAVINNCKFTKNSAYDGAPKNYGGAVRTKGSINVTNSSFNKNSVTNYGGAIYSGGIVRIKDSHFESNLANNEDGGVIYSEENIIIDNSIFKNNKVRGEELNKAYGGAVCSKKSITASNSIFESNHAKAYGGALYAHNEAKIYNCTLESNTADIDGGAIYSEGETTIENCIFKNNNATGKTLARSFGGAIRSEGLTTIKNSLFENNHAYNQGGAVYADGEIRITNSNFTKNSAKLAGAVYTSKIIQTVSYSNFRNNKATNDDGGAIYINNKCSPEFKYCIFEENICNGDGGAIYLDSSSAPILISNCSFNYNKADVDGGAVYSHAKTTVSNSKFDGNEATGKTASRSFGGAIRSEGLVTLTKTNFYNNYADNYGGAVYADKEIRITECNFEWNGAKNNGGAIYTSTIDKTISNSTFIGNNANKEDGGAIYIFNKCDPMFVSCRFEDNHAADEGGAIYLDSSHAEITVTHSTFVDNMASSGQSIYDCGYYYLVDRCWFGKNNPDLADQFKIWHKAESDEDFYPTTNLNINMKINDTEIYLGNKYHVTVYFISSSETPYKDILHSEGKFYGDGEFSNIIASSPNNITADVVFTKKNPKIYLKLNHQVVSLNVNAKEKLTSDVQILSCKSVEYPNKLKVDYQITRMTDASYIITNYQGAKVREGTITDPKSTLYIDNLDLGEYFITINNKETYNILSSNDTEYFYVYKNVSANVTADDVTYGQPTTISLRADIDGLYNVSIKDKLYITQAAIEMEVVNGVSKNYQVWLNTGNYHTHTSADNVVMNCSESSFMVSKANPEFKINVDKAEFNYGEDVLVSHKLPSAATHLISYYINDEYNTTLNVDYNLTLAKLDDGLYVINAYYGGDNNYKQANASVSFTVKKLPNNVMVTVDNVTYGEKTNIKLNADVDGIYQVDVGGTTHNITVKNGVGNISIGLNAGDYYANVTFDNDNYNTITHNTTFSVYKADIDLMIVVFDETYPDKAECIVYADRDGEYNLTIADHTTTITVKDNIAYYEHDTLNVGRYEAFVSFDGDKNYNPVSNRTTFTVYPTSIVFEIETNPSQINYGETSTVTHTISEAATGSIKYYLNNYNNFLGELDVNEDLTLPMLDVGNYNILGNYSGDRNYNSTRSIAKLTVKPATNNVLVSVDNVTYGKDSLITVTADVDGNYTVDVNGTILTVPVNNGVGNKTIHLNAGMYYANVSFIHNNYVTITRNTTFTVSKADNNVVVSVANVTYGEESVITVSADADGDYNVHVNETIYIITVNDGVGNKSIKLDAGNYYANITFDDNNYNTITHNTTFTVNKAYIDLVIVVFDETYPDKAECIVYASMDGEYILTLAGDSTTITVKDNIAYYEHSTLDVGTYQANVSYEGDDNHFPAFNITTFAVYPAGTLFEIEVNPNMVTYGETAKVTHILSEDAAGSIKYYLNNNTYLNELDVNKVLTLPVLDVGKYVIIASYSGDYKYIPANDSTLFTVNPAANIAAVKVNNVTYGIDSLITVTADVDGNYTVDVNGTILNVTVTNGIGNTTIALNAGSYYANVTFNNKNYDTNTRNTTFTVNKAHNHVSVTTENVSYGKDTVIEISAEVDGSYILSVNGTIYDVAVNNGVGNKTLKLNAGNYYANVTFNNKNYDTNTRNATFTVNKADIDLFMVTFDEMYPDGAECIVYSDRDGVYNLMIADFSTTVTVKDNLAYYVHSTLDAGTYDAVVSFKGDDNHNPTESKTTFTIHPRDVLFEIEANPGQITYGETATVTHTLTCNATGSIEYYLSNGTFIDEVNVNENLTLPILDVGTNLIIAVYSGDKNHNSANDSTTITIKPATNKATVNVDNITYGEDSLMELTANIDGEYTVNINGTIYTITVKNGVGNKSIKLDAGKYYANITFNNKNYNTTYNNALFEVYKADIDLIIVASDKDYPHEIKGIIKSNIDGKYNLTVGPHSTIVSVKDGEGKFNAGIFDVGSYTVTAKYSGDKNHNPIEKYKEILVKPAQNSAVVSVSNITYDEEVLIMILAEIDGKYQLDVNEEIYNVTINNRTGNISLILDAGKYYANITFNNKNYNTTYNNALFEVYKADTNILIEASNRVYPHEIDGYIYSNVDGKYNLTVANYSTTINIKNGIGQFNAGIHDAGEYNISVTYPGNLNYMANSSTETVVVDKFTPGIELNVNDINYGEIETINIICDVPGSVNVTVNNITETLELKNQINNGLFAVSFNSLRYNYQANLILENLNADSYQVTVVYNGDKNYNNVYTYDKFNVKTINVNMNIKATDINVGEDENITIQLSNKVNGSITISVDGKNYTKTVKEDKAVFIIPKLTAGIKNTQVYYSGDLNHNPCEDTVSFTVYKKESKITITNHTSYPGDNITFTARITDKQGNYINGGKVIFKLNDVTLKDENGQIIYARVHNGTASIIYNIPTYYHSKAYKITAVYGGNNEYLGSRSNNPSLNLYQRQAKLTLTTSKDTQINQNITFHVAVSDYMDDNRTVNGYVIFKIDGLTLKDKNNQTLLVPLINNTVDFSYLIGPEFRAKEHTITAVLINSTYLRSQENNTFNVNMTQTKINLDNITTDTQTAKLIGTITDNHDNNVIGTNKLIVKIDGITIKTEEKTVQYYYTTNGQINITLNTNNLKYGQHNIEVVTQERSAYSGARTNTILIIEKMTTTPPRNMIMSKNLLNPNKIQII